MKGIWQPKKHVLAKRTFEKGAIIKKIKKLLQVTLPLFLSPCSPYIGVEDYWNYNRSDRPTVLNLLDPTRKDTSLISLALQKLFERKLFVPSISVLPKLAKFLCLCALLCLILLQSLLTPFENLNLFFSLYSPFVHLSFNLTFTWKYVTVRNKDLRNRFQELCQKKLCIHTLALKLMTVAAARGSLQNLESYINITKYSETYLLLASYRYYRINFIFWGFTLMLN